MALKSHRKIHKSFLKVILLVTITRARTEKADSVLNFESFI